jgi:hypothetical protein
MLIKVKELSLCLTKLYVMKTYGVEEKLHAFLTSALDGGEWSSSRPGRCKPGATHPGTHWIEDWVGPGAGLGAAAKKIPSLPLPEIEPGSSSP